MAEEEDKKDLTSLVELSQREMAENPPPALESTTTSQSEEPPQLEQEEFESLEELSRRALSDIGENPDAAAATPAENAPEATTPEAAPADVVPGLEGIAGIPGLDNDTLPSAADTPAQQLPQDAPADAAASFDNENAQQQDPLLPEPAVMEQLQNDALAINDASSPEPEPEPVPIEAPNEREAQAIKAMPVVNAPPPGANHAVKSPEPTSAKQDLSTVKEFGQKIPIGHPKLEANPPFSVLISSQSGSFSKKQIKAIEDAITADDYGIRLSDIEVQLKAGKLLVPHVSEFAAVTLAQKLHDIVDSIDLDLAGEIFKSEGGYGLDPQDETDTSYLLDSERFESHREEVHDISAEPKSESDLFSSNLSEIADFKITRILSAVTASEVIPASVAENPGNREFEQATERLTRLLVHQAFRLGAHGVLGISFTFKAIDAFKDETAHVRRAYRLFGTGTAVRGRRI